MNELLQDIGFSLRNAAKKPGTAFLIVITLALGIGANSAMFSMTWHVILAPLPFADGDRLVRIQQNEPVSGRADFPLSVQSFLDYRNQNMVFTDFLEYHSMQFTLLGHGDPIRVQTGVVNWNYFDVLGIQPVVGRTFLPGEDEIGAEPLIVLSNDFWMRQFGGDPEVVGRSLEMNNAIHTVIGVMPPMPAYPDDNDIWVTVASCPFRVSEMMLNNRAMGMLSGYGKLKEGVSLEQADNDLNTVAQRLQQTFPDAYPQSRGYNVGLTTVKEEMVGDSTSAMVLLLGMAGLVVLIASANVANLNLARMAARSQELAIREAVGASPGRIARQLLTESILFAFVGGSLGLLIAYPSLDLLKEFAAGYTSLASEIEMDLSIILFTLVVALLTGVLSGSASVFTRRDINKALKEGGDKVTTSVSGKRRRQILLVTQFSLSFVILTTSALMLLSLYRLNNEDMGFDPEAVLVVSMDLNFTNYTNQDEFRDFGNRLTEMVTTLPEVEMAAISADTPLEGGLLGSRSFEIEGRVSGDAAASPRAAISNVSEDYHSLLGIPLQKGRLFTMADDENGERVIIINEVLEKTYFPNGNSLGQRLSIDNGQTWWRVIGVVGNIRARELDELEGPAGYVNFRQSPVSAIDLFVKSPANLESLGEVITGIVHRMDPQQAVDSVLTMSEIKARWLATPKLIATLIGLFGILALVVTLSGVIGVVSYNVSQRLREIGVHMAIGANPGHILRMFIAQGMKTHLIGLFMGLVLMLAGASTLRGLLYNTDAMNPPVYAVSALLLTIVVILAIQVPARRASRLNPTSALHNE